MIRAPCSHSLSHYKEILEIAVREGYNIGRCIDYVEGQLEEPFIILRHDIDRDPEKALAMAEIEHDLKLSSTVFVRVHGDYNIFSYKTYAIFKKILGMKHEIGLHYENVDFGMGFEEDCEEVLKREIAVLEKTLNCKVLGAASHGMSFPIFNNLDIWETSRPEDFGLQYQAYQFESEVTYVSDSSSTWRSECPHLLMPEEKRLYVLTHPQYWFKHSPGIG